MDHVDYEIAVEKKRRGQLATEEATALETHLQTCAQCREFESRTQRDVTAREARVEGIEQTINWAEITTQRSKAKGGILRSLWVYGGLVALLVGLNLVGALPMGPSIAFTLIFGLMTLTTYSRLRRWKKGDAIVFLRKEFSLAIRLYREIQVLLLLNALFDPNSPSLPVLIVSPDPISFTELLTFDPIRLFIAALWVALIELIFVLKNKRALKRLG